MVYITCFTFKAQMNHMSFLKEFRLTKILCVTIFDIICTSNFDAKCVHCTMETPKTTTKSKPNLHIHNICNLDYKYTKCII